MSEKPRISFKAGLLRAEPDAKGRSFIFLVLPKAASARLPARGTVSVEGSINGHSFGAVLKKRVCCFDRSGIYGGGLRAPKAMRQ
jgi:hypothetical protein